MMKNRNFLIGVIFLLVVIICGLCFIVVTRTQFVEKIKQTLRECDNYAPLNKDVKIDSTNLPVIYIETERIQRENYVTANVKIIREDGSVDYKGNMAIRYRGHASYYSADKKSYALRPLDTNGEKENVSLLGMKKQKKWVLKGNWIDCSMIRESIAYELAKKTEVATPNMRFCEVVLNGIYFGVYVLCEQPTRKMLGISKMKKDLSGAYLLYFARKKEADFIVGYQYDFGKYVYPFLIKYPDKKDITEEQKTYLTHRLTTMCEAVSDTTDTLYETYINTLSFIDFQLSTEFSANTDAYFVSGYMYKDKDNIDGRFHMCLWDGDHSFGMGRNPGYSHYSHWIFQFYEDKDMLHRFNWWYLLMKNPHYNEILKNRWREFRTGVYSDENVNNVVDSLYTLLTECGAMERNNRAWSVWTDKGNRVAHPHLKYLSDSFEDEVSYIKNWIGLRLKWMDEQLLDINE